MKAGHNRRAVIAECTVDLLLSTQQLHICQQTSVKAYEGCLNQEFDVYMHKHIMQHFQIQIITRISNVHVNTSTKLVLTIYNGSVED